MTGGSIRFAVAHGPLGPLLVAVTGRGVCSVRLGGSAARLEAGLRAEFPGFEALRDDAGLADAAAVLVCLAEGRAPGVELPLDVAASRFQRRVWEALRAIPRGCTRRYADVARAVGSPGAARAIGRACAANPVALLVPCHRVVPASGGTGGYRWGSERKRALLRAEARRERAAGESGPAAVAAR
jgi:AraC family transcriptional regulator of adaptative response/methylated-DNA-[protein]-cysteine methyltransferase